MHLLQAVQQADLVNEETLAELQRQVQAGEITVEKGLLQASVDPVSVKKFLAEYYEVSAYDIPQGFEIRQQVLDFIPENSAAYYKIAPVELEDDVLKVAVNDPDNLKMREALNFISTKHNVPYEMVFVLATEIEELISQYANLEGDVGNALESLETELDAEIAASLEGATDEDRESMEHIKEDAPVTKIVATILRYAVDGKASDIHIEPTPKKVGVRFRVDGALATSLELPKNVHLAVVARVKILSAMRLDERRKPQDGRFSATFDERKIDFRVSVLPTNHGEKVVMRILDSGKGILSLEDSGVSPHNVEAISRVLNEPNGIILISGPTGSGKSTTLRAMISRLDTMTENIMSLEDPVEYNLEGVSQSQVRPEIGYTFASGLRAALRQDPDVIMVGEIRDKETAQLAIQAALTGHLVLSTIHTNSAIGVIPRLIDMGVDPYLIAPTLKMTIAQRLARTLCSGTGTERPVDNQTLQRLEEVKRAVPARYHTRIPPVTTLMHPEETPTCSTGYRGRTAITEVLEITEEIEELILKNAPEEEFLQAARKNGFMTIQEDAMVRAFKHEIPHEEMVKFGSKVGIEFDEFSDKELEHNPVDNQKEPPAEQAIINSDETPTG